MLLPQRGGIEVEPLAQVLPDRLLALGLGQPPERDEIIGLNAVEVVFGLGIDHSEHRIGIGWPMDMRDAPIVANDCRALRGRCPARSLDRVGLAERWRGKGEGGKRQGKHLHGRGA